MKKNKELILLVIIGLTCCFVVKNFLSIAHNSHGGNVEYIISNPSIDSELWYILGAIYLLTIKVFFKPFFRKAVAQLMEYRRIASLINMYARLRQSRFFKSMVILTFFLLGLIVIALSVASFGSAEVILKVDVAMFVYFAYVFNRNYRVIALPIYSKRNSNNDGIHQ
jgi:hypothetical protein